MKIISKPNALWEEGNLWYGWAFRSRHNRYVFDDIGYNTCLELLDRLYHEN
jgi:hypothetical protein